MWARPIRQLYKKFFILEIPSILQILLLGSAFGSFLDTYWVRMALGWLVSLLLSEYLTERMFDFLRAQLTDPYSDFATSGLTFNDLKKGWERWHWAVLVSLVVLVMILMEAFRFQWSD